MPRGTQILHVKCATEALHFDVQGDDGTTSCFFCWPEGRSQYGGRSVHWMVALLGPSLKKVCKPTLSESNYVDP